MLILLSWDRMNASPYSCMISNCVYYGRKVATVVKPLTLLHHSRTINGINPFYRVTFPDLFLDFALLAVYHISEWNGRYLPTFIHLVTRAKYGCNKRRLQLCCKHFKKAFMKSLFQQHCIPKTFCYNRLTNKKAVNGIQNEWFKKIYRYTISKL